MLYKNFNRMDGNALTDVTMRNARALDATPSSEAEAPDKQVHLSSSRNCSSTEREESCGMWTKDDDKASCSASEDEYTDDEAFDDEGDDDTKDGPWESFLSFSAFTLGEEWKGHHLMCMHAYRSFLLVGTNQGAVGLIDLDTAKTMQVLMNHNNPISDMGCNLSENFVGSSDKAGCVAVQNLLDSKDIWHKHMDVSIQSIALHPQHHILEDRPVACAGADKVYLITKRLFLAQRRSTVLVEGRGRVVRVRWSYSSGDVLAWLTERGVFLLDYRSRSLIRHVATPVGCTGLELYPPTLFWETPHVLLCGWGDWVQEVHLRSAAPQPTGTAALSSWGSFSKPSYSVESLSEPLRPSAAVTDNSYRVCGLAPFGTERYLILACAVKDEGVMKDLEVRVVERATLADLYRGRMLTKYVHPLQTGLASVFVHVTHRGSSAPGAFDANRGDPLKRNDVPALYPAMGTKFFIVSADIITRATPCDEDDHVDFLISCGNFEEAYRYALRHQLRRHLLKDILGRLLEWYIERDQLDKVAALLPAFIEDDLAEWERWIYRFDQRGESWKLVDVLPNYTFEDTEHVQQKQEQQQQQQATNDRPLVRGGLQTFMEPLFLRASAGATEDEEGALVGAVDSGRHYGNGCAQRQQVVAITASLRSSIRREYYDLVLIRCLESDPVLFNGAVHHFQRLFSIDVVTKAAEIKYRKCCVVDGVKETPSLLLESPVPFPLPMLNVGSPCLVSLSQSQSVRYTPVQKRALGEAYGFLLQLQGKNEEALQVLLNLKDSDELFTFIRQTRIWGKVRELLLDLFERSCSKTLELLLEHATPTEPSQLSLRSVTPSLSNLLPTTGTRTLDPLCPESVVCRLEDSDRCYLWRYLSALRESNKAVFTSLAKRHTQLVATLYIDYDPSQLLPFFREMSMYFDKLKEIYALCKKNHLLDEMVFLMARMGREEEGLQVIVKEMKNMSKALQFIHDVPSKEDQVVQFKRLVQLVVEYNASLPLNEKGQRYVLHETQPGETFASIARKYSINVTEVLLANGVTEVIEGQTKEKECIVHEFAQGEQPDRHASGPTPQSVAPHTPAEFGETTPPTPCVVPLHLFSSLLIAAASTPIFAKNPAIDATHIIRMLPTNEGIAHVGEYIAAVARSRAEEKKFMATVLQVTESDLAEYYGKMLKQRTAAVRVVPGKTQCMFCNQDAKAQGIVVFACSHSYHPSCVLSYLANADVLNIEASTLEAEKFFESPHAYAKPRRKIPYCHVCTHSSGGPQKY